MEQPRVVVTIKNAESLTAEQRHEIALWLRRQGEALERGGDQYHDIFRARFFTP